LLALDDRPIVVHAFSNAGFWTYAAAMRALANDVKGGAHVRDRIVALVLDSAPGFPPRLSPDFATRSSAMAMMPLLLRALGRPPALSHPALDAPLRAFMRFWYHLSPVQIREIEESLAIVRDTGRWPVLALCSSADTLVPIEHVEAFVASMRERRDVRVVRWRDSEHVRHLLVHRHEYLEAMRALIDDVLARTV
jgi:alpha-beta hydrolase superfamily lysophospholipase